MLDAEEALKLTLAVEVDENIEKFFNEILAPLIEESAGRGCRSIKILNDKDSYEYSEKISELGFGDKKSLFEITFLYTAPLIRKLKYTLEESLQSVVIKW